MYINFNFNRLCVYYNCVCIKKLMLNFKCLYSIKKKSFNHKI